MIIASKTYKLSFLFCNILGFLTTQLKIRLDCFGQFACRFFFVPLEVCLMPIMTQQRMCISARLMIKLLCAMTFGLMEI